MFLNYNFRIQLKNLIEESSFTSSRYNVRNTNGNIFSLALRFRGFFSLFILTHSFNYMSHSQLVSFKHI